MRDGHSYQHRTNTNAEPTVFVLLDIDVLLRADPDEHARDTVTALADLFRDAP